MTEAFGVLRRMGMAGLPRNLAVLHNPMLSPAAVRYWARTMRSPMGELCRQLTPGTPKPRCASLPAR